MRQGVGESNPLQPVLETSPLPEPALWAMLLDRRQRSLRVVGVAGIMIDTLHTMRSMSNKNRLVELERVELSASGMQIRRSPN
jgi:hypothetical protein